MGSLGGKKAAGGAGALTSENSVVVDANTSYEDMEQFLRKSSIIEITDVSGNRVIYAQGEPDIINTYFDRTEGGPDFKNVYVHDWESVDSSYRGTMALNKSYPVRGFAGTAVRLLGGLYGMQKTWKSIKRLK